MNKTTKKRITIYALGILAVSAFGIAIAMPATANAQWQYQSGATTVTYVYPPTNNPPANNPPVNTGVPVIYSVSPKSATVGTNGSTVTITGANFIPGSIARWNSEDRTTTYVSATELKMIATTADLAGKGAYQITVYNPGPSGGISNPALFQLNKAVASAAKKPATTTKAVATTVKPKPATTTENNLSANALSSGFLPKGFIGWLLALILILLLVILARKAYGNDKYKAGPLKHA